MEGNYTQQNFRNTTAGVKQRLRMDSTIIANPIAEQREIEKRNTYISFADSVKCFDKLWLQDWIIELAKLGYLGYKKWFRDII